MKKLIIGIILLLLACISVPVTIYTMLTLTPKGQSFKVPGSVEVNAEKAGHYVLWNFTNTIFDGVTYSASDTLPSGVAFTLKGPEPSETSIEFKTSWAASSTTGSEKKNTLGYFPIAQPGKYKLTVSGLEQTRILSISPQILTPKIILLLFAYPLVVIVLFISGGVFLILGIIALARKSGT